MRNSDFNLSESYSGTTRMPRTASPWRGRCACQGLRAPPLFHGEINGGDVTLPFDLQLALIPTRRRQRDFQRLNSFRRFTHGHRNTAQVAVLVVFEAPLAGL